VVLAHLGLIAALSLLRRKNQALPMLTGRVEGRAPTSCSTTMRAWPALLLAGRAGLLGLAVAAVAAGSAAGDDGGCGCLVS
jgi:hypothetical protein